MQFPFNTLYQTPSSIELTSLQSFHKVLCIQSALLHWGWDQGTNTVEFHCNAASNQ